MNVTNPDKHRQSRQATGVILILSAACLFSIMGLGIRLGRTDFSAYNLVFFRSIIQTSLLSPWLLHYLRRRAHGSGFRFHFFRGLFGIFSMVAVYSSIQRLPLALATLLCMTGVAWAALFSRIFLKEKMTRSQTLALVTACAGLFLVVVPGENSGLWTNDWIGILQGLVSGICMGAAHTLIRKMRMTNTATREIVFYFGLSGILLTLPGFFSDPQIPVTLSQWRTLFLVGVIGSLGQILMTHGFRYATTAAGSLCILQQTPINVAIGFWILAETPPSSFLMGLVLTLAGLIGVIYFGSRKI